jgi:BirA family transcriptional regulator, biotin operon repressor / biotin---[acetyl-CoA-carboxylase] ligase
MLHSPLSAARLASALAGQRFGHEVQVHEEMASTSDHVHELGLAGYPEGVTVFAEAQTAGRGRRENRWSSEPGHDLLFSVLLRPEVKMELWPRLTTLAALALCKAIEEVTSLQPAIKWPNDVYLQGRKTAGILAETHTGSGGAFMVLGIGLNVNTKSYPAELQEIATSVLLQSPSGTQAIDRQRLAIALLRQLNRLHGHWENGYNEIIDEVRERSWLLGKPIRALMDGKVISGVATGLNAEGHLLMQSGEGVSMTLTSAEQVRITD